MARFTPTPRRRDPTPKEIAARCMEIQAGWTEVIRRRRLAVPPPQILEISVIHEIDLICAIRDTNF